MEDEDLNISMILSMGFGDMGEIKRALRLSKGDVNEAVSILMDQPNPGYLSMDTDDINFKTEDEIFASSDSNEFPAHAVFELENRVFQENWNIPYKREELLGVCLEASTRLAKEGTLEQNDAARKFLERILPEALRKLLTSNAIYRWASEIQEGIYTMCEMFIDLVVARLTYEPVPIQLLQTLGQVFDYTIDWHSKNKEMNQRTEWEDNGPAVRQVWAESSSFFQTRDRYGWLCDLINYFGEKNGFKLIRDNIDKSREPLTAKVMSSMLMPLANCAPLLVQKTVKSYLSPCMDQAFKFSKSIDEDILKSKDMNYLHDLCHSLKVLCHNLWPNHEAECDAVRLEIIARMLKTPHYNCRMNGLKEVCRLIEEADKKRNKYDISTQTVMEWMTENKILSVVLEGNIDQVQYTDKIKSIVEFLGPNLSSDEIRSIWNLGEEDSHVMDNVHSLLASASSRFNLTQLDLINKLVKEKWAKCSTRIKEKLIALVGQIGKETVQAKQVKAVNSVLALLWELAHSPAITRHLVELALKEHLNTLSELNVNVDPILRQYILCCVDDIKKNNKVMLPFVKHLHDICKSYGSKSSSGYQKASEQILHDLNRQHKIVNLISISLNKAHRQAVESSKQFGVILKPDTMVDTMYTHQESVNIHLELMQFMLKDGDLYLSWARCKELWDTLITNEDKIQMDQDCLFTWFTTCFTDLEADTQKLFYKEKLLSLPTCSVSHNSFTCLQRYFEGVNASEGRLKKNIVGYIVENTELLGMNYLWDIVINCDQDDIAERAMELIRNTSNLTVSLRLFIKTCFNRLETSWAEREDCQLASGPQGVEVLENTKSTSSLQSDQEINTDDEAARGDLETGADTNNRSESDKTIVTESITNAVMEFEVDSADADSADADVADIEDNNAAESQDQRKRKSVRRTKTSSTSSEDEVVVTKKAKLSRGSLIAPLVMSTSSPAPVPTVRSSSAVRQSPLPAPRTKKVSLIGNKTVEVVNVSMEEEEVAAAPHNSTFNSEDQQAPRSSTEEPIEKMRKSKSTGSKKSRSQGQPQPQQVNTNNWTSDTIEASGVSAEINSTQNGGELVVSSDETLSREDVEMGTNSSDSDDEDNEGDSDEEDELKPGGVFQDLPPELLRMVLNNLPEVEIKKTRRLSKWYEERVTAFFPSIFCNFNIKFSWTNISTDIMATLDRAMLKSHNKGNTMKLKFEEDLTTIDEEMLTSYQGSIVALDIKITGDEDFLIQPSMKFDLLESLSVGFIGLEPTKLKTITESLIIKHASKLKKLRVADWSKNIDDLNVPALPCLESLTLNSLKPEPAWSLFRASKQTITSLEIKCIDMNTPINNADENETASIYQVPNLQNLDIYCCDSTKILIHNATNVVSLVLTFVNIPSELPELPQLRELNITGCENHSPIFYKCKGSLKCLVFSRSSLDDYAVAMPQLTDLCITGRTQCGKFLSYNHKSLEFIYLQNVITNTVILDDGVKMERVKAVVLKYDIGVVYTEEDRARMAELCPNADILIWNNENYDEMKEFVLLHQKRRGFTSNL